MVDASEILKISQRHEHNLRAGSNPALSPGVDMIFVQKTAKETKALGCVTSHPKSQLLPPPCVALALHPCKSYLARVTRENP